MLRLSFLSAAVLLAGCADSADAPPDTGTDDPVVTTPAERPAELDEPDGFVFHLSGGGAPLASYALDEGGQCLVYAERIIRVAGSEDGESREMAIIERTDASPFEQCDDEGDTDLPSLAATDSLLALDSTVLWTLRRPDADRTLLTGRDIEADETLFDEPVTSPVEKDSLGVTYGGPPETMESLEALQAAGVECANASAWFAEELAVAISRRLRFTFEDGETTDTGEARCFVLTDA